MSKVALRVYNHEIEGLIEGGQLNESVAHCQHILKTYPMYVDTYRLLGKAFLESRRYADAADIFQRTLMAVPDDFVAHVGMSIIRDDENKMDDAIWHMERAFEVQPSNPAIQGELRRLYGRRDGVEPPKIRLSRDALANMYSQGELFTQAIAEIRDVLSEDPNRPDLHVMLARAYYRAGKKVEAAEMAATLLKKFPYCLDAIRVLVDVLPDTSKGENVQAYRQRLILLDPYSTFAKGSVFNSNQVPDASVEMERLEYRTETAQAPAQPDWASSLGIKIDSGAPGEPEPTWMSSDQPAGSPPQAAAPEQPAPGPFVTMPAESEVPAPGTPAAESPVTQGDESIPGWMRTAGWKESSGVVQEGPMEAGDVLPAEPTAASEMPDWLKSMAPTGITPEAAAPESEQVPIFPMNTEPVADGDIPDWLSKTASSGKPETPAASDAGIFETGQVPDVGEPAPTPSPLAEEAASPALEAAAAAEPASDLSWLEDLAPKNIGKAEEMAERPPESSGETPDWLDRLAGGIFPAQESGMPPVPQVVPPVESPVAGEETAAPAVDDAGFGLPDETPFVPPAEGTSKPLGIEDDTMAWLEGLAAKQGARPEELLTKPEDRSETPPDWIRKSAQEKSLEPEPKAAATSMPEIPLESFQGSPDEAQQERPQAEAPKSRPPDTGTGDLTITSWLNKLDVEEAVGKKKSTPAQSVPSAEALPDWLKGLEKPAAPGASSKPAEDTPAWLRGAAVQGAPGAPSEPAKDEQIDENAPVAGAPAPTSPEEWLPVEKASKTSDSSITQSMPPEPRPAPAVERKPAAPRATGGIGKTQGQEKDVELFNVAQAALNSNQLNEAMLEYGKLIKKGRLLEEVIHELKDATYRFPVDIIIWQTLGDAYMRANRLQEALDAYNKAEELLR